MNDPFESPRLCISHAREEIEDAGARVKSFFELKPFASVVDIDPETRQQVHKIRLTSQVPSKVSAIVKDAVGSLRDALDHAVYGCAVALGNTDPRQTGFPFAQDAKGIDGELNGKRLFGNPPELRPYLAGLKPYPGGNDLLCGLNSIRNPNTHRMIVPIGSASMGADIGFSGTINGPTRIGYNRWDPVKKEIEFCRFGEGTDVKYQVSVTFDVAFDGTHALSGKPVFSTLFEIATEVERVVNGIEAETARILRARGG